jgi:ATP-binding cassette, subfamily B, bacterial HlyB/CyaB
MTQVDHQVRSFLPVFSETWLSRSLPDHLREAIASKLRVCCFNPGDVIYRDQELPSEIHCIVQGQVRILGASAHQSPTLSVLGKGSIIGWDGLMRRVAVGSVRAALPVSGTEPTVITLALAADEFEPLALKYLMPATLAATAKPIAQQVSLIELFDTLSAFLAAMPSYFSGVNLKDVVRYIQQEELATIHHWYPAKVKPVALLFQLSDERVWLVSGGAVINTPIGTPINLPQQLRQVQASPFPVRLLGIDRNFLASAILKGAIPRSVDSSIESAIDLRLLPGADLTPLEVSSTPAKAQNYPVRRSLRVTREGSPSPDLAEDVVACFDMVCQFLKLPYRPDAMRRQLGGRSLEEFEPLDLCVRIAQAIGLDAKIVHFTASSGGLNRLSAPAIVPCRGLLTVLYEAAPKNVVVASPRTGLRRMAADDFALQLDGDKGSSRAVILQRQPQMPMKHFGFSWFFPLLAAQRGILIQVLMASAFVQVLGLANPLLVQQVIDKVIVNANVGAMPTFGLLMVAFALLEGVLTVLRTYLFANTTLRLDLRLGTEVIRHLLRLPLGFFEKRPVGELSARLSELEKIRQFLTGTALTAVLDVVFSTMYVGVMFLYSVPLTVCVLLMLPVIMLSTVLVATIQRRLIRVRADHGAKVQSYLIEALGGMFTVKAQHMEGLVEATWRDRYVKYLTSGFTASNITTIFGSFSQFLNTLSGFLVLWVGAGLVIEGKLTLGGLIAFRILSGSVTGPFTRLSRLWQQVQEASLSMELLADIVESPLEADPQRDDAHVRMPNIEGKVQCQDLCFGFKPGQQQLSSVSLEIPAGAFVGVVGQSGSGKSTLVKLIPRLYQPQSGHILIDGFDISKVKLSSLRRQIGYVPQDSVLFEGSIRDNITLFSEFEDDEVIAAARVANAHDFIMQLPEGYNTQVGERGGMLSGGQRQRIAIARVVASNPRLLIFDEATSALDYETERQVCAQLRRHFSDRTVFFITHRLNTVAGADWIVYMQSGVIVEQGTHAALMASRQLYYSLFSQASR